MKDRFKSGSLTENQPKVYPTDVAGRRVIGTGEDQLTGGFDTVVEAEASLAFEDMKVTTEGELDAIIHHIFKEICGTTGESSFFSITVPAVKKIYGTNYRKAGLRLLDIINRGAEFPTNQIESFFSTVVRNEEFIFVEKREAELERVKTTILDIIKQSKERFGGEKGGVVGVIIFGSYAKGNFQQHSDLDIVCICATPEETPWVDNFLDQLNAQIHAEAHNDFVDTIVLDNEEGARLALAELRNEYILVSPYKWVVEKMKQLAPR